MKKNYIASRPNRDIRCGQNEKFSQDFQSNTTKKWLLVMMLLSCMFFTGHQANAQNVVVTGAVTGNGTYATLGAAFTAIGTAQSAANILISINNDTSEGTATATLGAGTWATVTINPSGARTISGTTTAGNPMIDFSGADNVTINGLNSGGNSLVISNTTASATSGTATVRFVSGATNNTITNCSVLGSASMAVGTNGGVIYFATDGVTANGNDGNTVSNCTIGPAGANLPSKGIYGNGSTTTTAIQNSGITINNNNIADVFGAAVQSAGIYLGTGNTNWTITNNKFYQTVSRTWTTGAIHRGIDIQNATQGQGFTITGNIIGYASNTQTGVYTLIGGTTTSKFTGIVFNGVTLGTSSAISNNTIAAVSFTGSTSNNTSTSSPFSAIIVVNGVATTSGNTIGSQSATGSLVYSTTTTSATDVYGIYNFSSDSWISSSNTIGGISVTNAGASGTFLLYGLRANTGSTVTWTAASNFVGGTIANSIQLTATGAGSQVVGMYTSNAGVTLTSNTIRNLVSNNGTGTTSGASVIGINLTSTALNNTLSQNTIYALSNSSTTLATIVNGIVFTGGSANVVERNLIYGLTSATTSTTAEIAGIRVTGGTTTYRNNMIALGNGQTNAIGTGATNGINGIIAIAGTDNFFHNTVFIAGAPTAGVGPSFAFNNTTTTNTRSFRDNIFFNARNNAGATGKNYIVQVGGTAANPSGLTINNNIYFASGTGAVFGRFNALDVASLAAWKTAVGQDVASINADPQLLDPTNATPDLHIHPTNPTSAEANGFDVGVTNDFDGQTRSGLSPVDIGADAGNFTGLDLIAPSISYTPLPNGAVGVNQVLTATITDAGSGVPTTGAGLPTLYYKINAGAYTAVTGVSIGSNQYTFTFGSATTIGGDVVSYYVVAQDLAATPNVTAFPLAGSAGYSANPPAASTPPTTPSTFSALGTISGTKTVCASGCTYTSLTNAGGAFAAINSSTVNGNVNIEMAGDSTAETGANALNAFNSPFTVKIYPTTSARVISGALASAALVKLNGADRVTIDGSIGGTGTDLSLTITNTSITSPTAVGLISLGAGAGAVTNTVKNCNISTGISAATGYGIAIGGSTPGTSGADNDDVTIQNNNITVATISIYANGTAAVTSGGDDNLVISGNAINSNAALQNYGIEVGNALTSNITQNTLSVTSSGTVQPVAISLETGFVSSSVTRNTITNVFASNVGGYGSRGITVGTGTASSALTIANNIIYGVNGTNWNAFSNSSSIGIAIGIIGGSTTVSTTAGGINLYYNSVRMTGSMGSASTTALTAALYVGSGASALDIRNNIFANTQTGTATGQKNYAIYSVAANTAFTTINYNDYYVSNSFNAASAIPGFLTSDRTNLAGIVAGFGGNANSTTGNPQFTSDTNLHINPVPVTVVESTATPIGGITIDYDGDTRNGSTPDIGADEGTFTAPVANDISATAFIDPVTTGTKIAGVAFTPQASFTNTGSATQTAVPVRYRIVGPSPSLVEVYNNTAAIASIASSASSTVSFPAATITATGSYTIYAKAELVGDAVSANDEISGTLNIIDTYTSATTTQNTNNVAVNTTNQQVIGLQVVTSAAGGTITSISFNTTGTTTAATDITNAKIFWTGNTSTFSATGQFGSTVAAPNGAHVVSGTQALANGTNYFWLTYDVPSGATSSNVIDAEVTSITVNGTPRTPTITAPAGVRNIVGPMNGTYLVGAGKTFPNFTNLTAAFADLAFRGVSAAVILSLDTDYVSTSETFPLTIGVVTGVSVSNTITIKPAASATPTISGSNSTTILNLVGAKYVTVDGSNTIGGTTKNLTISNTNTSGAAVYLNTDATNNTIKNSVLKGVSTSTGNGVVYIGAAAVSTGNDNNTIQNNDITSGTTNPANGIYNSGSTGSATLKNSGNVIRDNNIFNFTAIGITDQGGSVGTVYSGNQIFEVATMSTGLIGFDPHSTTIEGFTFNANRIYDLKTTATGSVIGVQLWDILGAGPTGVVTNNMIALDATNSLTMYGIYDNTAVGEIFSVQHNTVSISGTASGAANSIGYFWNFSTTTNFRNNIISNTRSGGTAKHYVIKTTATTPANLTSNYNDLYSGGGTASVFGNDGTADRANLAAWQTATSKDANSISYAPVFASATDLHLTSADTGLDNLGTPIATVTTDYDGQPRSATTPDMGADEFTACTAPTALSYTTNPVSYCANTPIATNSPTFSGSAATSYTVSPALPAGLTLNGTTGTITGTPTAATAAADYLVTVNNACGSTSVNVNITINASSTYYADTDGDGFGAGSAIVSCSGQPANTATNNTDCAPADPLKWRTGNFYVDADNDGFYNGNDTPTSVCYGANTPTGYTTTIIGADCNDGNAEVNANHVEVLGNGIDDNCSGVIDENVPGTSSYVNPNQCGVTLTNISNTIYAYQVAGATGYRFEVTNGATVRTYDTTSSGFNLFQLPGAAPAYATTYSIRVAVRTGGFWRAYSTVCTVTTPSVPATTTLTTTQCGSTIALMSTSIYANQVTAASMYRFEVSGGSQPTRTYDSTLNRFAMTNLSPASNYATTYSVRVAMFIGGVWQDYGAACSITTPASPPTTSVTASQCGITISNSWTSIYCNPVTEATGYRFEVKNGAQTRLADVSTSRFSLYNLVGGPAAGTVYSIRVAILYNGVYQAFGPTCTVTTAAVITRQSATAVSAFAVKASPNPFADTFKLDINTSSEDRVEVKVYDMIGKLVEARQSSVAEMGTLEVGSRFPSGVYNIVVTQGENVKTLRVIKR